VKVGSGTEGVLPIIGVVGWYDTTKSIMTERMGVRALTECMGDFATINARIHSVEEVDRKSCRFFIVEPGMGVPVAGLVSVKLESFDYSEGTTATMLGVFVLGVSDEGSTHEVGVEATVSTGTHETVTNGSHAGDPIDGVPL
jgi:hypothetical protein